MQRLLRSENYSTTLYFSERGPPEQWALTKVIEKIVWAVKEIFSLRCPRLESHGSRNPIRFNQNYNLDNIKEKLCNLIRSDSLDKMVRKILGWQFYKVEITIVKNKIHMVGYKTWDGFHHSKHYFSYECLRERVDHTNHNENSACPIEPGRIGG